MGIKTRRIKYRPAGSKPALPITRDQFDFIVAELADRKDWRMVVICRLLFKAIRGGDVLHTLKIHHLYHPNGDLKDAIRFAEQKTGKQREIPLKGEQLINALKIYWNQIKRLPLDQNLFYSQKGQTPLTDAGVKKILKSFVGKRGIAQLSFHSFRKGAAKAMFQAGARIEVIADVLNHHATRVTERYICITPRDVSKAMEILEI